MTRFVGKTDKKTDSTCIQSLSKAFFGANFELASSVTVLRNVFIKVVKMDHCVQKKEYWTFIRQKVHFMHACIVNSHKFTLNYAGKLYIYICMYV